MMPPPMTTTRARCRQLGHRRIIPRHAQPPPNRLLRSKPRAAWSRQNDSDPAAVCFKRSHGPHRADGSGSTVPAVRSQLLDEATLRRLYANRAHGIRGRPQRGGEGAASCQAALRGNRCRRAAPARLDGLGAERGGGERTETVEEFARPRATFVTRSRSHRGPRPHVRAALRVLRERTVDAILVLAAVVLEGAGRPSGTAELTARLSEIAGSSLDDRSTPKRRARIG